MTKTAKSPIDEVLDLLDLEKIEENIFRGQSPEDRMQRVFGGQVLGRVAEFERDITGLPMIERVAEVMFGGES